MSTSTLTAPAPPRQPVVDVPQPLSAIERLVAEAPPLGETQRDRLAVLVS